ncbi:hypothetical protein C21_00709 [Arenibacter sp. NBRC 103722]|uniref:Uncharacterized protein n=1 Tax=Arenibacter algicola TaxID=616991 RepID=A0A221UUB6_9FLAO|nr:hypothetical protein AREALGSMS7_01379 [Arenibacter algicola]GBF18550.1 hypothetical protein C21_00709 [Arenibacter sp. NBRC 103722]
MIFYRLSALIQMDYVVVELSMFQTLDSYYSLPNTFISLLYKFYSLFYIQLIFREKSFYY